MAANPATATFGGLEANSVLPARHRAALADLAFASVDANDTGGDENSVLAGRHLAFLPTDAIELALSDPANRRFGDYELIEQIGEGGMGVVYRAHQTSLERDVAIKLLAAGPWASREFIDRFLREARHAARMQHPNIVTVYEVGTADELHYFSMRLVQGTNLAEAVQREGPLDPRRAASLMRIVAEAVAYAHSLDVLHLDLKPANVLLDESGAPHVADFGLARKFDRALALGNTEISGTPSYMAPEQAELGAQPLSPATDLWGLGAILYEIVTACPPFRGETTQMTLELLRTQSPERPCQRRPDLPADLEAIILKCLARDPAARYARARELADDLGRFLSGYEVRARPLRAPQRGARWARREPKLAITAVLALATLLIGLAATTTQWRRANANAQRAQTERQLAANNATISSQRLWDGRRDSALRLMRDGKGFEALGPLITNIEEKEAAAKASETGIERREIGMIQQEGVVLVDRMIIPDANPMATALSPDGSLLAVALNDISVRWYDAATLTERGRVDLMDQPTSDGAPRVPILLRFVDAHRLCVTGEWFDFHPGPGNGDTWFVDLDLGRVVTPPAAFADLAFPTYSADGRHALLRDRKGRMQLWQVEPWRPLSPLADGSMIKIPDDVVLDPGLRFALDFGESASAPQVFDPRRMTAPRPLALPPHESFSAWAESANGAVLALGTSNGQVILIDPATMTARQLSAPAGSEVTWLAFSEDDAWLAATRRDGSAFAFDVISGDLLHAGQMQHAFETTRIEISHRDRLVVGSGLIGAAAGDGVLWRLPEQAPVQSEATRLLASPTRVAHAGPHWMSVAFATGLVATADAQGEVRLWRLPGQSTLTAVPPRLVPSVLYNDGTHFVDADDDRLRVVSLANHGATSWLHLPAPIAFAELVDGGKTLAAVARTTLHVLDAATLASRRAPVPLRGTPQRFAVTPDGKLAALSFGHNGPNGFEERIEIRDLAEGSRVGADDIVVKGPLRHMALSPDATRLLAVGPEDGATDVFDTRSLARLGRFAHDPTEPVISASFTASSRELWLVTRNIDETQADNPLLTRWDPLAGMREQRRVPGAWPYGVAVIGDKPILESKARLILDPGAADERAVSSALNYSAELSAAFAVSHDGRLIAHGSGRFVQLYDATTLEPVGAPLQTGKSPLSLLAQLAFTDDDRHLVARTQSNWHFWPIAADERTAAALRRDADLLAPRDAGPRVLDLADAAEHARLRSRDPGPRETPAPRPPRNIPRWIGGEPLPPRDADAGPLLLDLGAFYNRAPASNFNTMNSVLPSLSEVPYGITRLDGVDYDWRGALELRSGFSSKVGLHHKLDLRSPVRGIPVPPVPIAALHVLLYAPETLGESSVRVYARVRLHYRDGSEAVLPIRTQREVLGWTEHDRPTPIGWVMGDALGMLAISRVPLFNDPRLPNPHPERRIATLDLETAGGADWSTPIFFAITAEPVIAGADSGMVGGEMASEGAPTDSFFR